MKYISAFCLLLVFVNGLLGCNKDGGHGQTGLDGGHGRKGDSSLYGNSGKGGDGGDAD